MRKLIAFFLVTVSMFVMAQPVAAVVVDTVEPRYVNVSKADVSLSISSSGVARIKINCYGNPCIENTSSTTYLQKKVDGSWRSIKTWSDSSASVNYNKTYEYQLSDHGQYRVLTYFRCTGETSETITETASTTY